LILEKNHFSWWRSYCFHWSRWSSISTISY